MAPAFLDYLRATVAKKIDGSTRIPSSLGTFSGVLGSSLSPLTPCPIVGNFFTESQNKLFAFSEFRRTFDTLSEIASNEFPPASRISPLFEADSYTCVWRTEGLGAYLTSLSNPSRSTPSAWIGNFGLQPGALLPLHTGAALTLAKTALIFWSEQQDGSASTLVSEIQNLANDLFLPGLQPCAIEALGLIVQSLRPDLLTRTKSNLRNGNVQDYRLFAHGVGRGLYFDPLRLVQPSPSRNQRLFLEDDDYSTNALSGYAWATTLVNIRSSETVVPLLADLPADTDHQQQAVAEGVSSAVAIWLSITGDETPVTQIMEQIAQSREMTPAAAQTVSASIQVKASQGARSPFELGALFSFDPNI